MPTMIGFRLHRAAATAHPTMSNYRRWRVEGGTFFFTVVTHSRAPLFADALACKILGDKFRECQNEWPFTVNAIVLLPEHLHAIWTLPSGDANYSRRWAWIKKEFTKEWLAIGGREQPVSRARWERRDHGIWQPRYWEHTIDNERDFDRHFDYIHYNPIRHGHVIDPADWPNSSFHRWLQAGVYEIGWGAAHNGPLLFDDLDETAMEME
jgi:putative transposase